MSIPDERTAQVVGLIGAVAEVCVRIFFFNLYLKTGVQLNKRGMTDEEAYQFAMRGKMRVMDGSNDMVVEYLSSIVSALLLIHLSPLGVFSFASTDSISQSTILTLCAYQIIPELFMDVYVTFMESFCGLSKLHQQYWNPYAGSNNRSRTRADRVGDLLKGLVAKVLMGIAILAYVLMATVKQVD